MTACALASLKALESRLEKSPRVDQAVKRGKGWLATRWDPEKNPGSPAWRLFYLEWVCRALDGETKFGSRDWKSEVLQTVRNAQRADGSISLKGRTPLPAISTAFGLEILRRTGTPHKIQSP